MTQIAPYLMVHQLDVKDNLLKVLLFPDYVVLQKRSPFSSAVKAMEEHTTKSSVCSLGTSIPSDHFTFLFLTGLGKTKRKTSARDASPTPSTDAEYPSNGSSADRIYDLNIPAYVKFAYVAEREDELSLVKGSRVIVMEKCSDGWWRGSYNGQIGWFPSNYVVEEVEEATADSPSFLSLRKGASMSNGQGTKVLHVVQTLYPFSSVTEEELNFEKGETMEVIEKPENDPEWWKCKNSRGQIGLVPKNYVVIISDGPTINTSHPPQISYTGPSSTGRFAGREWYYGNVTRHQAECALNERGVEGDFLVRDSESSVSGAQPGRLL